MRLIHMGLFDKFKVSKESPSSDKGEIGQRAEEQALHFLKQQQLKLRDKNFRCKFGEIDLIMVEPQQTLVFVEVRYRKSRRHGSALESVNYFKQQKLIKAAEYYLQHHGLGHLAACRFDVIAVEPESKAINSETVANSPPTDDHIHWIKDAFSAH